ncbi:MAG: proton-conducting transporter membrane subunit [Candidatus Nanopelagicales bacterium]|nr:proton-conducting transporter membrane subunit [Candidatus Nanopelagicales bacterium]
MAVAAVVATAVMVTGVPLGSAFVSGISPALGLDPLSAFFVLVISVPAVPVLIYATASLAGQHRAGVIGVLTGAFLGAMLLVTCARDISTFLAGWELMTLIPAAAILVHRTDREARQTVFIYLALTHLGGTGVWLSMILLSEAGVLADPTRFAGQAVVLQWAVWIAALIGFGVKAGLMPFHVWLPRAHPVAPSHLSALMSGVMLKVAIYGLVRILFFWATPVPTAIGLAVVVLGAVSCVGGITYALFQRELKRLLAFSSIENVGIIALGLGAALLLEMGGQPLWASLAFAAALLHTLNHAVFKSLLFLGAGSVQRAVHSLGIDHLGGLSRRMPWTAAFFILGAIAIAGLPPLNGFVSEWLTLQSLIQVALDGGGVPWSGPLAAAILAATAALAALCFVKVIGLVFLGQPRTPSATAASEVPMAMRVGPGILAGLCVVLGLLPALLLPALAGLRGGPVEVPEHLGLQLPGTGGLPPLALAVALVMLVIALARLRRGHPVAEETPPWTCGGTVEPSLAWTSSAFTKPLRLSWDVLLRPVRDIKVRVRGGITQELSYRGEVPHVFDTKVYEPVANSLSRAFARVRRLQSGLLRSYASFLVALVALLLLVVRLGGIG